MRLVIFPLFVACAYSSGVDNPAKPPSAAAILDRYIQVTGGQDLYRKCSFGSIYSTVTRDDKTTFNTSTFHSRDGRMQTEIDAGPESSESGVSNGIVWEFSEAKGARILSGKVAQRKLAEAREFGEDEWREQFPTVKYLGQQVVLGANCYHLKLTRADGSSIERFYDQKRGLLVREISTQFDEAGQEQPVITDMNEYSTWLGLLHPSLMHVKTGNRAVTVRIDSLSCSPLQPRQAFEIPHEVARAAAERRGSGSLPNAVDLADKFIQATGGKEAYQSIRTEVVKAEISFKAQNLQFPLAIYTAKNKMYTSLDIPSLGKFEFGTDGQTAWQRSVVLGPRLEPASSVGGLFGPNADEVLRWADPDLNLETVSKEEVNGSPCYLVRMGTDVAGQPASTACFDVKTGYLLKTTSAVKEGTTASTIDTVFSDYRETEGLTAAQHIETKIAGQLVSVDVKEIVINHALPNGIFDLPADVRALKEKRQTEIKKDSEASEAPSIRKK